MRITTLAIIALFSQVLFGQVQHQVSVDFNGMFRLGDNSYDVRNRPGFGGAYGLRAHRHFQLDIGVEFVPRPIGTSACCRYVDNAADNLYLVPFGGRFVLGPADGRWEFGIGGGGAYMNHRVGKQAPGFSSGASGAGGYALASGNAALRKGSRFRIGGTARIYRFGLNGFTPARLLTVGPEVIFRF